jgi:hypothetical protein
VSERVDTAIQSAAAWAPAPPALPAALETELGRLSPVQARVPMKQLAVLVGGSFVYALGLLFLLDIRDDLGEMPTTWVVSVGAAWLLGFVTPVYLALVPRRGDVLPRWQLALLVAVVASIGFVVLGLAIHPMGEHSVQYGAERFGRGHVCLEIGLATALVPVLLGAVYLRRSLPVASRPVAAALGAGGGCLGGLVLHAHCHVADGLHVGLIHGGVVVLSALLAAAIVPRATTLR